MANFMIEPDKFQRYLSKAKELASGGHDSELRDKVLNHIDIEVALNGSGEQTEEWVGYLRKNALLQWNQVATDIIPTIECVISPPTGKTLPRSGD